MGWGKGCGVAALWPYYTLLKNQLAEAQGLTHDCLAGEKVQAKDGECFWGAWGTDQQNAANVQITALACQLRAQAASQDEFLTLTRPRFCVGTAPWLVPCIPAAAWELAGEIHGHRRCCRRKAQ